MDAVLWLVHGTWARHARWTREGSFLRRQLQDQLGPSVSFATFGWTGRNAGRDREGATERLVAAVQASSTAGGRRFAIAHSHGGNVAVQAAVRYPDLFDGVITLNTPFLTSVPRNGFVTILSLVLAGFALAALAQRAVIGIVGRALEPLDYLYISLALVPIYAVVIAAVVSLRRRDSGAVFGLDTTAVRYGSGRGRTRILCVSFADDEATSWLAAFEALSNIPSLFLHRLMLPISLLTVALLHYVSQWTMSGPVLLFNIRQIMGEYGEVAGREALVSAIDSLASLRFTPEHVTLFSDFMWRDSSPGLFALVFAESVGSYFITGWAFLGLLSIVGTYGIRAVAFGEGFGIRALAGAFLCRLAVSSTPMVSSELDLVIINQDAAWRLRHSAVYENRGVTAEISKWVKDRLAASAEIQTAGQTTGPGSGVSTP